MLLDGNLKGETINLAYRHHRPGQSRKRLKRLGQACGCAPCSSGASAVYRVGLQRFRARPNRPRSLGRGEFLRFRAHADDSGPLFLPTAQRVSTRCPNRLAIGTARSQPLPARSLPCPRGRGGRCSQPTAGRCQARILPASLHATNPAGAGPRLDRIHTLRSFGPSPSKNARRTQRVMQWYQRVTAGSTNCARAMVIGGSSEALHATQSIESS